MIAVCIDDPPVAQYESIKNLPPHLLKQLRRCFEDYKVLEGKKCARDRDGVDAALHRYSIVNATEFDISPATSTITLTEPVPPGTSTMIEVSVYCEAFPADVPNSTVPVCEHASGSSVGGW